MDESKLLGNILHITVIPGTKVCVKCKIQMYEMFRNFEQLDNDYTKYTGKGFNSPDFELRQIEEKVTRKDLLAKFNATLQLHDLTPTSNLPR